MVKKKRRPPKVRKEQLAKDEHDFEPLEISDELNEPPDNILAYSIAIYGPKAVGKSSLAANFPDAYTLMAEPMRKGLKIRQQGLVKISADKIMDDPRIDPWPRLKDWARRVVEGRHAKAINFDTIDQVHEMATNSVSARNGVLNPSKAGKDSSAVWIELREEFEGFFNELRYEMLNAGMGLNFISHTKERDMDVIADGEAMTQVGPSAAPAAVKYMKAMCDYAFYYGWDGGDRILVVRDPSNALWYGCGPEGHFLQPDGKPLKRIKMPNDPKKGFATLERAFNNEVWDINTPDDERGEKKKGPKKRPK